MLLPIVLYAGLRPVAPGEGWSAWERAAAAAAACLLWSAPARLRRHLPDGLVALVPAEAEPLARHPDVPALPLRVRPHPRDRGADRGRALPARAGLGLRPAHGLHRGRPRGPRRARAPGPSRRRARARARRRRRLRRQPADRQPVPRHAARRLPVPHAAAPQPDRLHLAPPAGADGAAGAPLPAGGVGCGRRVPPRRPSGPRVDGAGGGHLRRLGRLPRALRDAPGARARRGPPLAAPADRRVGRDRRLGPGRPGRAPLARPGARAAAAGGRPAGAGGAVVAALLVESRAHGPLLPALPAADRADARRARRVHPPPRRTARRRRLRPRLLALGGGARSAPRPARRAHAHERRPRRPPGGAGDAAAQHGRGGGRAPRPRGTACATWSRPRRCSTRARASRSRRWPPASTGSRCSTRRRERSGPSWCSA